jgi:thiosulfate dehydrogenase (quinone) large subunit
VASFGLPNGAQPATNGPAGPARHGRSWDTRAAGVGHPAREGTVSSLVDIARDRPAVVDTSTGPTEGHLGSAARYLLAGIRLALGWVFLWAFLDKLFGFGIATPAAKSWLNGGSPTKGFLGSSKGPFADVFHSIAGNGVIDVLFMAALLAIGVALILGIGMRLAAGAGALVLVLMWAAVLPPSTNPFMDDHLVYAAVLVVLALVGAGNTLGLGRVWTATPLVRRVPWLA